MKIFKAPNRNIKDLPPIKVFLAGSISGKDGLGSMAEDWQTRVTKELSEYDIEIYNPRRDDWDSSWKQDPTEGTEFHEQVTWELEHIEEADLVLFYFDPNTKSPITLMELGLCLGSEKENVFIYCPQEFFRYGNVVVTTEYWSDKKVYINEDNWLVDIKMYLESAYALKKVSIEENIEVVETELDNATDIVVEETPKNQVTTDDDNSVGGMYTYYNVLSETKDEKLNQYIRSKYSDGKERSEEA